MASAEKDEAPRAFVDLDEEGASPISQEPRSKKEFLFGLSSGGKKSPEGSSEKLDPAKSSGSQGRSSHNFNSRTPGGGNKTNSFVSMFSQHG